MLEQTLKRQVTLAREQSTAYTLFSELNFEKTVSTKSALPKAQPTRAELNLSPSDPEHKLHNRTVLLLGRPLVNLKIILLVPPVEYDTRGDKEHLGVAMCVSHKRLVEGPGLPEFLGAQFGNDPVEDPREVTGEAKQLGADVDTLATK